AHPEALVGEHAQLAVACQLHEWFALDEEVGIVTEVLEERPLEDEESTAHHAGGGRLLVEVGDPVALEAHLAVAGAGSHAGDGAQATFLQVEVEEAGDVDIPDTVTVCEQERVGVYV